MNGETDRFFAIQHPMVLCLRFPYLCGGRRSRGAVRSFDLSRALGARAAQALPSELPQFAAVDRLWKLEAVNRSPAALMMSIDIQIAIWSAVRCLGRARALAACLIRLGRVRRLGRARSHAVYLIRLGRVRRLGRARSLRCCAARLNRPAFSVARGRLARLGRGLLLHDLDLGDDRAVPSAVPLVLARSAVGRWEARPLDDEATRASGALLGLAFGGSAGLVLGRARSVPLTEPRR